MSMQTKPTGHHLDQLTNALLDAFDHNALTHFARLKLNIPLEWITPVAGKRDLITIASNLVSYFASQEGGLKRLLAAAIEANPTNPNLLALRGEWADLDFTPIELPTDHPSVQANNRSVVAGSNITNSTVVTGDISVGEGDLVLGDKTVEGDEVHGDKFIGDKVAGDKNVYLGEEAYNVSGLKNPYLGLAAFTYAERDRYAGRKAEIDQAIAQLTDHGSECVLLFVTGASGSGKSSFAQAGLLPALEEHYARYRTAVKRVPPFRPGKNPMRRLEGTLSQLGLQIDNLTAPSSGQVSILIIDQFEELFSQSESGEKDAFFAFLTDLPPFGQSRLHIITTMRSDYLPDLFDKSDLYEINRNSIDLRVMTEVELTEAIQQPLWSLHGNQKRFQDDLLFQLVNDTVEDATHLPLLQITLKWLWDEHHNLTVKHYTYITDAISNHASVVYNYEQTERNNVRKEQERSAEDKEIILAIFRSLYDFTSLAKQRRDVQVSRSINAILASYPNKRYLIDELVTARLLRFTKEQLQDDSPIVSIIHESLFNKWDILNAEIEKQHKQDLQRGRFERRRNEWAGANEDQQDRFLLENVDLAEAEELSHLNDTALNEPNSQRYLELSIQNRERSNRRRQRIQIGIMAALTTMLLVIGIVAWVAIDQNQQLDTANQEKDIRNQELVEQRSEIEKNAVELQNALRNHDQISRTLRTTDILSITCSTRHFGQLEMTELFERCSLMILQLLRQLRKLILVSRTQMRSLLGHS